MLEYLMLGITYFWLAIMWISLAAFAITAFVTAVCLGCALVAGMFEALKKWRFKT
jgi:hypothetical protein